MSRALVLLGAPAVLLALLGIARALPDSGSATALRLAAALALVLLPGALIHLVLGGADELIWLVPGALVWSLTAVAAALALTFLVDGSLTLTLGLFAGIGALALILALWRAAPLPRAGRNALLALAGVTAVGLLLGVAVWWATGAVVGDGPFHVGRVRKLADLPDLTSIEAVNEFREGGPHPGYAFPVWHAFLALVSKLAGLDPATVFLYLPALLTPLALLVALALGTALFGSWAGGLATATAQALLVGLASDGVGEVERLSDPELVARLLLVPALLALFLLFGGEGGRGRLATLGAAAVALAMVHPTYVAYAVLLVGGFLAVRLLWERGREEWSRDAVGSGLVLAVSGAFLVWLLPTVGDTSGVRPNAQEQTRDLSEFRASLDVAGDSFSLSEGALTLGRLDWALALALIPLGALAARRRWAAFVVGGALLLLAVGLVPVVFEAFSDLLSLSQARRVALFLPLALVVAGAAALAGRLQLAGVGIALAAALVPLAAYGWELSRPPAQHDLSWAVWIAVAGGALALAAGRFLRLGSLDRPYWTVSCALAFTLPFAGVALAGAEKSARDRRALTGGLVQALREQVGAEDVVLSNPETSYRISAYAPGYVVAVPISHVADTRENQARERLVAVGEFFDPEETDSARRRILERWGVEWIVVDRRRHSLQVVPDSARLVYEDSRFALLRI